MTIKLSKEAKQKSIESIKRYFEAEMGEEIGDLKASLLLNFCLQEICPSVYNQAIIDAKSYINDWVNDLDGTCYEPEFGYWKK
ncbi:DUF2164 domain-containing protein [Pleurocapsa sp. FMAR1]|uniref:DUF2164 domain-containing protein n=1 Tax=Pleurocapsa sp. FMAR1 TaxID=3040204 RepID=UPI0029C6BF5A|nr:DUF2164 domain-containing protein [Pleurocapsa sp. FMAR1]